MPTLLEKIALDLHDGKIVEACEQLKTLKKGEDHKIKCDISVQRFNNELYWAITIHEDMPLVFRLLSHAFDQAQGKPKVELPFAVFAICGLEPDKMLTLLKERKIPLNSEIRLIPPNPETGINKTKN
ncbi:MAG: hypothetical protein AMJ43_01090 [Coxiella sp. DG_40]|nr:MAG: hypothetical protein AMJ43_01090 [Coxiella sp. DG_40]